MSVTITQYFQHLEVGWIGQNQGTGMIFPGWFDYLYLSPTNVFDANAVFIGSGYGTSPLGTNQTYQVFANPSLPNNIQGAYYLLVLADVGQNIFESKETNNVFAKPLQIVVPPVPDVSIASIVTPVEALSGQEIEIRWVLTNHGNAAAVGPFRDVVYLATTPAGDGLAQYGDFEFNGIIPAGGSVERVQHISIPLTMSGQRWVYIVSDAYNQLFEFTHKSNNSLISSQPVLIRLSPTPNLTVTEVNGPPESFSGSTVLVTWAVTNQGTGPTRSPFWYDGVYLSADTNFGNDTLLNYTPNAAYLAPGESYANAAVVSLPRGIEGTYYFFVKADAASYVFEHTNENDNVRISGPMFVHLTPPPDLQVATINPPLTAFSGQSIPVSWSVTNYGLGQTLETAWYDRVYLSTNNTVDGNDPLVGTFYHVGGLEPGGGYRWTNTVNLPVGLTGDWNVLVVCDAFNSVYEVPFDGNNQGVPAFATTIFLTPPPDLATAILESPTNALASHGFAVKYSVANEGTTTTPNSSWVDYLYLSADDIFSPGSDLYVGGTVHYGPLSPGFSYTNTISTTLPNGLSGVYHVFLHSDAGDAVYELDNTNNVALALGTVTVVSKPADFAVRSLSTATNIEVATAALISWVVTNYTDGDSAVKRWYDQLVLSSDNVAGNGDDVALLYVDQFSLLGAFGEYAVNNATFSIPITTAPGQYRLFVLADRGNQVYEGTNENNNASAPFLINVTRTTADLVINSVTAPASATAGGSLPLKWTVQNVGNRNPNSGYWNDSVYLSTDRFFSPGDLLLGHRQNVSMLVPGARYTNSFSPSLPSNLLGDYYLVIHTDSFGHVAEPGLEDNNVYVSPTPISIAPATAADLAVTEVNAPAVAYSGQTFDLTWAVTNAGTATASGSWYDAIYLSLDHFLDPFQDTYVGFAPHSGDVAAGGIYTNSGSFDVPAGFSGPYFVLVKSDSSGLIYEAGSEINNVGVDPEVMEVGLTPPVDLVAGPITIPANATPGVNVTIDFTVFNGGSNIARGSWEDSIYISADTNFDIGDTFFGQVKHKGDVAPGGFYTNRLTAPLPGVLPGDYHVIVRSDILNHLVEQNRTNNIGASLNSVAIDVEPLVMSVPDTGTIAQGQSVYYKFNATAGETVRVRFTTGVALAGNEMFVSYGQMPTRGSFDFAVNEPFVADPDLFIPIAHTGTHYLLVYSSSLPAAANYSILAEVLPFTVATVQPAIAGDKGETTFKIRGALFNPDTKFELLTDSNSVVASSLTLEDSTTAYATFNLASQPQGYWSLKASMTETSAVSSTLSNSVLVVSGRGSKVEVAIDGPLSVWAFFTQPVLLGYGNSGDSDALAPLILVYGVDGTLIGTDPNQLQSEPLQILGRSLEGPSDRLRPQTSHSHRLVYRGGSLHVRTRAARADDIRPISDQDWLEIESSARPRNIRDADWLAFWSGIRPRVGNVWGDYVKFLHRIAADFPAEQRNVRDLIGSLFTNQPAFRASSYLAGVVRGATNDLPLADVGVGFYLVTKNGAIILGGSAITDASGQFLVPHIQPGTYVCVIDNTPFDKFDMDRNGKADSEAPTFTLAAGGDLPNETIYLHQPESPVVVTNNTDATLLSDNQGVLHMFWYRSEQLWHAWNDAGTWVDAAPIATNQVSGITVAKGAHLLDGSTPGLIVVWSQDSTNGMDLFYAVGQTNGVAYRWSLPVQLTADQVVNSSPSVVVRGDGVAVITYLKRNANLKDDTDVYYSGVNIQSGALLWNVPAPRAAARPSFAAKDPFKQTFKWAKSFKVELLGVDATASGEASGEFTSQDCDAGATAKFEAALQVENDDFYLKESLAGDLAFGFYVDPDECDWAFRQGSAVGNFHGGVTVGAKNFIFQALQLYPPTKLFGVALEDFMRGFADWTHVEFENAFEVGATLDLLGGKWEQPPAKSFGYPTFQSAEATISGGVKFGVKYEGKEDFWTNPKLNLNPAPPGRVQPIQPMPGGGVSMQISGTAEIYPQWKPKTLKITPLVEVSFPFGISWTPNYIPEFVYNFAKPQPYPVRARDTNYFSQGTLTFKPDSAIGSPNIYGANSVVANVQSDLLRDGAPSLALDGAGLPYQIWFRELDPYGGEYGSQLRMADYTGAGWTSPTVIPGTKGFNSQVAAATDALGQRMAVWVHGDASSITTNTTAEQFFAARNAVDLYYAVFDGSTWSAPQPVALTQGADSELQVSYQTNGNVLAVWTYSDTSNVVHLLVSSWNGTSWTTPQQVTSGKIHRPTAQQVAGATYVLWTAEVNTNRNKGLFQSVNVGGSWSDPEPFQPKFASRPEAEPFVFSMDPARYTVAGLIFGEIPDKCCECKGKSKESITNGVDQGCGIALTKYDYAECRKYFEFKSCPRISSDPNDIVGPPGFGPEKWVAVGSSLNYTIRFENDPLVANAPAKQVIITLPLDGDLNPSTFRLGSFGFGDINVNVPADSAFYQTTLDLTVERGFYLDFIAGVDVAKREAFWRLTTIDPVTGFLPLDPLLGFLPPNNTSPEGEGFVNFTIRPKSATVTGAHADAKATIVFDTQPPLDTPAIFNAIDASPPVSAVLPLPAATYSTNFNVQWSGNDGNGESGLASYDIYVSEDGADYTPWLADTTLTESPFVGEFGVQYSFYSVAKDNSGNIETAPGTADATILVVSPNTAPVLAGVTNRLIFETVPFSLAISATDTDTPPNTLTFELLTPPAGMSIGTSSGLLSWTPSETQGSTTNLVTVKVTDDGVPPLSATNSFTITVLETNAPPVFIGTNLYFVDELTTLSLTNRFTDSDVPTNQLTLQLVSAPAGAVFDPLSGVLTWTPGETNGPSTNQIVVRATDDGSPAATTFQTNTLIVREVNSAPSLDAVTNRVAPVLTQVKFALHATDGDQPTNTIAFALGAGAPASATLGAGSGEFRWTPPLSSAGSSNFITLLATDNGVPPLTATQHFAIAVPHFVQVNVGTTNLLAHQTSSVPLQVIASAPWRNLAFTLDLPATVLDQVGLSNVVSVFTTASLTPIDGVQTWITFTNASGHELQGTQQVALLNFTAGMRSVSLPLTPQSIAGSLADGSPFLTTLANAGRIVIVADQPVLDALTLVSNRHTLRLYGNLGEAYEVQTATNLLPPVVWQPFTQIVLSNLVQTIEGDTNSATFRIYRAVKQ